MEELLKNHHIESIKRTKMPNVTYETINAYKMMQQEESRKAQEAIKNLTISNNKYIQKAAEQYQHHLSEFLRSNYSRSMESIVTNVTNSINKFHNIFELFDAYYRNVQKQFEDFKTRAFEDVSKIRESILALISIGWYPDIEDFGYSMLRDLKDDIDNNGIAEIDAAFVEYYQGITGKIEEKLAAQFPGRAHIIKEAFKAHKEGNYIISIPLIMTQIDGIAFDTFKTTFFEKSRGKQIPKVSEYITDEVGDFSLILLLPFQTEQPIIFGRKERGEDFNHLNRHQVLHGESTDYHTEVNSCRVISLIYYISQAVEIVKGR